MAHYGIFETDTLIASQLLPSRSALPEPERSLMVAVFEDAVRCFLNHCRATERTERALYQNARKWIESLERSGFYGFENVCETLGLAPDYTRRQLRKRRDERREHDVDLPPPDFSQRTHRAVASRLPAARAGAVL